MALASLLVATLVTCCLCAVSGVVSQIKLAQGMDPTSMSITWSTDRASSVKSNVIYGTSKTSLSMRAEGSDGKAYTYQSFDIGKFNKKNTGAFFPKYTSPNIHTVLLNNLTPGTTYYYRCGDTVSSDLSSIISFTTLPAVGTALNANGVPLTFAIMADTSTNGVVNNTAYLGFMNLTVANIIANSEIGMVLLPGDLNYADCNAPVWDLWDDQNAALAQKTPFMVSAGNHEQEQEPVSGRMYTAFEARYAMPRVKPAVFSEITLQGGAIAPLVPKRPQATFKCQSSVFQSGYDYGNSFYSFNAGLAHVIFLNAYTHYVAGSNQYNWLVSDLSKVDRTKTPWIIVNFHTPWYNTHKQKHNERVGLGMKKAMEDLFYKYHVNAAFSGHVHAYERFLPMYKNVTKVNATIYMTIGAGGQENDGNQWVGVGPASSQEPYNSVDTRNAAMYGYGTLTINSPTVATWNMFKNSMTQSPGESNIDSVLICNSYMGSAICPFTTIPPVCAEKIFKYSTVVSGVTASQATESSFQTAFISATATALNLEPNAITITSITSINVRRKRKLMKNGLRLLSSSSSVSVMYDVLTQDTQAETTTALTNSITSVTTALNTVGESHGFTASVSAPAATTLETTPAPSSAPAVPPTVSSSTVAPSSAPSNILTASSPSVTPSLKPAPSPTASSPTVGPSAKSAPSPSTSSPTLAPSVAPDKGSPLTSSCFAGSETILLESGAVKAISDVSVGDRVLAASATGKTSFSDVIYIPHRKNKQSTLFTHITTVSGGDVKMTQNHILPSGVCGSSPLPLIYASEVSAGNCIMTVSGEEKVHMVEKVQGEGVYTIVTNEEYVVVNGIIASPFGANHMMANMYYNIHRFLYTISPSLLASTFLHSTNEGLGIIIPLFGSV